MCEFYEDEDEDCCDCDSCLGKKKGSQMIEPAFNDGKHVKELSDALMALPLSHESLKGSVESMVRACIQDIKDKISNTIYREAAAIIKDEVKELAQEHIRVVFLGILDSQMVVLNSDWKKEEKQFSELIKGELEACKASIKSEYRQDAFIKTCINQFFSKGIQEEIESAVKQAHESFRAETLSEIKKEAGQRLTKGIATAIATDPKLLRILEVTQK